MEWGGRLGSGVSQKGRPQQAEAAVRFYSHSSRQFSAHPLARIDKRAARAARKTRYRYNQIGPLDHKKWLTFVFPWPYKYHFLNNNYTN